MIRDMRGRAPIALLSLLLAAITACSSRSSDRPPPAGNPPPVTGGLDARPQNLTCLAPDRSGGGPAEIELTPVFQTLSFSAPLAMLQAPGDDSRWFVLEKGGRVRVFANDPGVTSFDADFIDLDVPFNVNTSSEGGLLGMAFAPDFATRREVYLSWTEGSPMVSRVDRFRSNDGGLTLDSGTRETIISVNQPFGNHNGGQIAFDQSAHLFVGLGDGGDAGDPQSHAQDTTDLLGAVLRLDVDGASPYSIPPTNPFAGNPICPADHSSATSCPEIYAWGLRNPWRWSFDRVAGTLWLGDVGQGAFEEIDIVQLGRNYGWDCREGFSGYSGPAPSCATATGLVDPVHAYGRSLGTSVTGGYVYRGSAIPALTGDYLFADYGSGRIWRLIEDGIGGYAAEELLDTTLSIASFGEDSDGEVYIVDIAGGRLFRIDDASSGAVDPNPVPDLLSATGCFNPADPSEPLSALIPYDVAAPFWSDGADKERWIAVPDGRNVAIDVNDDFVFPVGTVLAKHFRLDGELVETRLLMRHPDGGWAGYSYEWNAQLTDATLVDGGKTTSVNGQDWIFPDGNGCLECHTEAAGFSLGLELAQLNGDLSYAATGRTANQLETLDAIGLFTSPLGEPNAIPALADPYGTDGTLQERARAYLHTNCAQCHRPGTPAGVSVDMDLRFTTALAATGTCAVAPQRGDLGIVGASIIAPGSPDRSVLLERLSRRGDPAQMPPLASSLADAAGVALVRDWITSLSGC
ncbi:MAG TPA: PQQ-dependent sugar dehydrogenase [Gammaproteobacteria bacterium]|nr:PQQ-dependent sugar dehydrogenase [Gammaproteobacteria bacterium]